MHVNSIGWALLLKAEANTTDHGDSKIDLQRKIGVLQAL